MNIAQVMQTTAGKYRAKHFYYSQARDKDKWRQNPTGVCFAMCKIWLREITKTQTHAMLWIIRELDKHIVEIDNKQTKDMAKLKAGLMPKSLKLGDEDLEQKPEDWVASKALYKANEREEEFWPRAASLMANLGGPFIRKNLICLYFGSLSEVGHTVAACKQGEQVYFFDPNGGVLQFDDESDLEEWLKNEFPKALVDEYEKIALVKVYDYKK
jgi:hypothetical protein